MRLRPAPVDLATGRTCVRIPATARPARRPSSPSTFPAADDDMTLILNRTAP
jgi:hypothetical protein